MSARSAFTRPSRRAIGRRPAWGAALALLALAVARADAETAPSPAAAGLPSVAAAAPHHGSPSRPDYDCSKGGFCGTEGWEYGSYAKDTKESTGCGPGPDGVDLWDLSAAHSPTLPDFAKPYCAFFYGFATCSLPTVICEN